MLRFCILSLMIHCHVHFNTGLFNKEQIKHQQVQLKRFMSKYGKKIKIVTATHFTHVSPKVRWSTSYVIYGNVSVGEKCDAFLIYSALAS